MLETREAAKALDKAPVEIVKKFQVWRAVVQHDGPSALRAARGFNDEALAGEWKGF
jgi:hypothetical protein